ncbi:hypothetical protein MMC17_008956 [Xylographa soralifera]|nr:hypothetical protein [Xylographa soralifera]
MPGYKGKPVEEENPRLPDLTNPNDITIWNPGQTVYSKDNPHPILGRLEPPPSWFINTVTFLLDNNGQPLIDRDGQPIKDFQGWPRYISSQIGGHDMEVLFRSSCRVTYADIWARQPCWVKKPKSKMTNRMNQRRLREGRLPFKGICWSQRYATRAPPKTLVSAVAALTANQIRYNTNFLIQDNGIIAQTGGQVLPLDFYIPGERRHKPGVMLYDALVLVHQLARSTRTNRLLHWTQLPEDCLPGDWRTRGYQLRAQNEENFRAQAPVNQPVSRRRRRVSTKTQSNKKPRLDLNEETTDENQSSNIDLELSLKEESDEDTGAGFNDPAQTSFQHAYGKYHDGERVQRDGGVRVKRDIHDWLYRSDEGSDQEENEGSDREENEELDREENEELDQEENQVNDESNDYVSYNDDTSDLDLNEVYEEFDDNATTASDNVSQDTNKENDARLYEDEGNDEVNDYASDSELDGEYEEYDEGEVDTATHGQLYHAGFLNGMSQTLAPEPSLHDTDASEEGHQTPTHSVHEQMSGSYSSPFLPRSPFATTRNFLYEDYLDNSEDEHQPLARSSTTPAAPTPRLFYSEAGEAFTNYIDSLPETWIDPDFQF